MKQILLMIALVALVGCGKKPIEESVFDLGRPDITKPSKPPAKTEEQIEAENKAFDEAKAKAEAGDAEAQYSLGVMYDSGEGVAEDKKKAAKWYRLAADQGDAIAQTCMGWMYSQGQGVEQNYVTAYAWASIAATNGDNVAPGFKSQFLEPRMTTDQIAETGELVKEMVKKNPKLLK